MRTKLLLTSIAALSLATGTAHAVQTDHPLPRLYAGMAETQQTWTLMKVSGLASRRRVEGKIARLDYEVALATYHATCQHWPGIPITLRQGVRVIEDSRRLRLA
jgi:hypothetical protein